MKRFLATFWVVILSGWVVQANAQELTRLPYLQNMKPDSVEVLWKTDQPSPGWVDVWKEGTTEKTRQSLSTPLIMHQMLVPGLQPNTRYTYQVGSATEALSIPATFQTFPATGGVNFEFVVYGDHRNNPAAHSSVAQAILKNVEPRFILDTGDYTGQGEHETDFWDEQFFKPAEDLLKQYCLFPVIGNHESERRHPRIPHRYLENFSVPTDRSGTEYYYSFDFGDAHFCMIDVYASDFTKGSKQYAWIRQDLKKSNKTWKFATMHYPVYVYREAPSVTYGNEDIREHLVPLFRKYGVTMVFSGDSHFYQRSESEGIHYVCSGGGGAPLYDPSNDAEYVRASYKGYHYAWAELKDGRLNLRAYDDKNQLIDSLFGIPPRKPERPPQPVLNFTRLMPEAEEEAGQAIIIETRDAEGNLTEDPVYEELGGMMSSSAKSQVEGLEGSGSRFSDNEEVDGKVRFVPPIPHEGAWLLSITTPSAGSVNAPNTLFEVTQGDGELIRGRVDLSYKNAGDKWFDIGLFNLKPGDSITLTEVEDEPGRFYVDAIKLTEYGREIEKDIEPIIVPLPPTIEQPAAEPGQQGTKTRVIWIVLLIYLFLLFLIALVIVGIVIAVRAKQKKE